MSEKVGRKTDLTEDLFRQIKESILNGNDLRETAKVCDIPESTLYTWHSDNYLNITDKVLSWKHERMLKLAETNLEGIMGLGISDKDSIKVVADVSKFVSETLGKKNYSKQVNTDLTSGGKPIMVNIDKDIAEKNNVANSEPKDNS